ncbi:MAG: hypothetical protein QUS33_06085 [Dehalococcoidia bacterium]|nr:hypothetical protein [Dehalococcoidia bacterium]
MGALVKNAEAAQPLERKARVYVLVTVAEGLSADVASVLRRRAGVVAADVVEGEPSVIMVVEAEHRLRLAHLTIQALSAVEKATVGLHLMPAESC